jgi:hypothetical protein
MIVEVKLPYSRKYQSQEIDELRNFLTLDSCLILEKDKSKWKEEEQHLEEITSWQSKIIVDFEDFLPWAIEKKIHPEVTKYYKDVILAKRDFSEDVQRIIEDSFSKVKFNQHVSVVVPGAALLEINDIYVEADSCTELIQDKLNDGWKILAIFPQAQRRPDYILGRKSLS